MKTYESIFALTAMKGDIPPNIKIAGRNMITSALSRAYDAGFDKFAVISDDDAVLHGLPQWVVPVNCEKAAWPMEALRLTLSLRASEKGALVTSTANPLLPPAALKKLAEGATVSLTAVIMSKSGRVVAAAAQGDAPSSEINTVELGDEGPEDIDLSAEDGMEKAKEYIMRTSGMPRDMAIDLLKSIGPPLHVMRHCVAVAAKAMQLAERAREAGYCLDTCLLESAAILHDSLRLEESHEKAAADLLASLGYDAVGKAIASHMRRKGRVQMDEGDILYLADKLVEEDKQVTIDQRYEKALSKFSQNPTVLSDIKDNMAYAYEILSNLRIASNEITN